MTKEQKAMNNVALNSGYPLITQYIRDKGGRRVGMMVAFIVPGDRMFRIGHSKCNMNLDEFDSEMAFKMAVGRACTHFDLCPSDIPIIFNASKKPSSSFNFGVPRSVQPQYQEFIKRACRYFRIKI